MQAMILAAGFGTRLLPYTHILPKPLFPVIGYPLLELIIDQLKRAGVDRILINCHHRGDHIVRTVSNVEGITLQCEKVILGTGGGLRKGLSWMEDEPLIVVNGDVYHTIDLRKMVQKHYSSSALVTLAVHDYPRFNSIAVNGSIPLGFSSDYTGESLAFTGVHVMDPGILHGIKNTVKSCIIERYKQLLDKDKDAISLYRVDDCYWTDMGTPADYINLNECLLLGKIPLHPLLAKRRKGPMYIDKECSYEKKPILEDWASIGKARIGKNVRISRSVVWDGAEIPDNSVIRDTIVAP